jgi:repressor LexA
MLLMGRIAAGRGLEAIPSSDEVYSLYSTLLLSNRGGNRYVLRVKGNSMYGAHIADGDVLIVEENEATTEIVRGATVHRMAGSRKSEQSR